MNGGFEVNIIKKRLGKDALSSVVLVMLVAVSILSAGCSEKGEDRSIKLVKNSGSDMVTGLNTGSIDAMIGWEPYNAEAIVKGYGYTLMNSSDIWPHHPCCVLAYDYNWYSSNETQAEQVLNLATWVHMRATDWLNEAKDPQSANHSRLIQLEENFTDRSAEVLEYAMKNVDFDYHLDPAGIKTYTSKLEQYKLFNENKWSASGYKSTDDYVDNIINSSYLDWAIAHRNSSPDEVKLRKNITIDFGYLQSDLHQIAFYISWQMGWFEEVGIKVDAHAPFANGGFEMTDGFRQNSIDIGYLGIAPAVLHGINSNDFTDGKNDAKIGIIAGVNYNGSALVARTGSGIHSIKELEGKTVAYPGFGTVQYFLVLMAAEKAGVSVEV